MSQPVVRSTRRNPQNVVVPPTWYQQQVIDKAERDIALAEHLEDLADLQKYKKERMALIESKYRDEIKLMKQRTDDECKLQRSQQTDDFLDVSAANLKRRAERKAFRQQQTNELDQLQRETLKKYMKYDD